MKVLMINSSCGVGSTGRICTDLADALENDGNIVKIAYGRVTNGDKRGVLIGNKISIIQHVIITRLFDKHGLGSKRATQKFINWVELYNPDIIHLHNLHGYYLNYEILFNYLNKTNKKVIWTLHDCWPYTGHCAYYSNVDCNNWERKCRKCSYCNVYPKSICISNSKNNYERKEKSFLGNDNLIFVTPSKWLEKEVKKSFLKKYRIYQIYNGIDLEKFRPIESNFRKEYHLIGKKIILGVANIWTEHKGLKDFVKLSDMLDDEYRIVLVGELEKKILGNRNNIIHIEKTNCIEELAKIYTAADVFFNPSRQETMGLVTVEAMACGTPVITYNLTAVPEVVGKEVGVVVDANSNYVIEEVINIIKELNYNRDFCVNWAKKFEKNKQYQKYLKLYYDIYGDGNE